MNELDVGIDTSPAKPRATKVSAIEVSAPEAPAAPSPSTSLQQELDRVSLTQALIDTEAATVRVIDLTERLVDARLQITELRGELEALRIEHHQMRAEHEELKGSMAFRLATLIWNLRNALRL